MHHEADSIAAQLAEHITDAWNAANGAIYAEVFTLDASFVDIRGAYHTSRTAIGIGHQKIFDTIYRDSNLSTSVLSVRVFDGVILAQLHLRLVAPNVDLPPNDGSIASLLIVDDAGTWRISAFQNTLRLKHADLGT